MKTLEIVYLGLQRCFRVGFTTATACLLISCASVDSRTTQYVGAPHPPPTDPAIVQILRTEPTRPHEKIGEVLVDATTDPAPPVTEIEARLRKEGAKIGGDAVVRGWLMSTSNERQRPERAPSCRSPGI